MKDGTVLGFQGQPDRPATGTLAQAFEPLVQVFGRMFERALLGVPGTVLAGEGVGFITPVQTNPELWQLSRRPPLGRGF